MRGFVWSEAYQKAFEDLKALLKSVLVLHAPDFEKKFAVCVDVSDIKIGGVPCQEVNDVLMPVACMAKSLKKKIQ